MSFVCGKITKQKRIQLKIESIQTNIKWTVMKKFREFIQPDSTFHFNQVHTAIKK